MSIHEDRMIDRFSREDGKKNLIDALLRQKIVSADRDLAERLATAGEVVEFQKEDIIVAQDGGDDDVYFLISGTVNVLVNHQLVGTRAGGEVVGEMAAIDCAARRAATLKAETVVIALRIKAADLTNAGGHSAAFWKYVAQVACDRLRERAKFHLPANEIPIVFLGSSVEGLPVARAIEAELKHDPVIVRLWTRGVFGPSGIAIEELLRQVDQADFGIFAFGPDDKINSRNEEHSVPRDNVILEMGLFVGRLGRERVFMVKDADVELKIPSDLFGVLPITYKYKPGCGIADVIGPACTDARDAIRAKGVVRDRMKGVCIPR